MADPIEQETGRPPSIALSDVHVELPSGAGPVTILRGLDLTVAAGEIVGVVGPSGAGKSTMMMVIGGLERPTSGRVAVAGRDLTGLSEDDLARFRRDHVGIVFQNFHLVPTMTALENVAIPLEFAGRADAFDRAGEALEAVGLGHRLTHYPSQLSGGEQQRTALARAFAPGPGLVLADEPTGNLDGGTGGAVMDLMFTLTRQRGASLMLITHDAELAGRCDRVVHLEDGRITDQGGGTQAAAQAAGAG
ncbi:MAG: ABC transporter ATP-binding protein [Rhodospirillaceae bacterium]|nr:ABC transporter ATP-binding protein [Rhodospirillaceae bacterium]